mmetsp:Transcript_19618/g.46821  ORF Transcript_19618/g.46821 Transcript_19618/m.46821 type:complete len:234 (-) Transcript_19618:727-1428(-)
MLGGCGFSESSAALESEADCTIPGKPSQYVTEIPDRPALSGSSLRRFSQPPEGFAICRAVETRLSINSRDAMSDSSRCIRASGAEYSCLGPAPGASVGQRCASDSSHIRAWIASRSWRSCWAVSCDALRLPGRMTSSTRHHRHCCCSSSGSCSTAWAPRPSGSEGSSRLTGPVPGLPPPRMPSDFTFSAGMAPRSASASRGRGTSVRPTSYMPSHRRVVTPPCVLATRTPSGS